MRSPQSALNQIRGSMCEETMKKIKLCKICGIRPATIPDRNQMGRPVKTICEICHRERLRADVVKIVDLHNKKSK